MLLRRRDKDDDYDDEDDEDEDDDEAEGEAEDSLGSESSRTQMQIDGWLTLEAAPAAGGGPRGRGAPPRAERMLCRQSEFFSAWANLCLSMSLMAGMVPCSASPT